MTNAPIMPRAPRAAAPVILGPAPVLELVEAPVVAAAAPPVVDVAAAEEEDVEAGTSSALRVPQVLHVSLPGLAWLHCAKVAWQMWLGRVSRYSAIEAGSEPLLQVQA